MARNYDLDELLAFAQRGDSALQIIETLGLSITGRRVQQIIRQHLGPRPTRKSVREPNVVREAVVAYMESCGLNPRHCSNCGKVQVRGGAIRSLSATPSLDSLVFVCIDCATPGDV